MLVAACWVEVLPDCGKTMEEFAGYPGMPTIRAYSPRSEEFYILQPFNDVLCLKPNSHDRILRCQSSSISALMLMMSPSRGTLYVL